MNRKKASKMISILMENGVNTPEDLIKILEEEKEMAKKFKRMSRDKWKDILVKDVKKDMEDMVMPEEKVETNETVAEVKEEIKEEENIIVEEKIMSRPKRESNIKNKIMAAYEKYVEEVRVERVKEETLNKNIKIISKFMLQNMASKDKSLSDVFITEDLHIRSTYAENVKEKGGKKCFKIIGVLDVFKGETKVVSFANFKGKLVELTKSETNSSSRAPLDMSYLGVNNPEIYIRELTTRFN